MALSIIVVVLFGSGDGVWAFLRKPCLGLLQDRSYWQGVHVFSGLQPEAGIFRSS